MVNILLKLDSFYHNNRLTICKAFIMLVYLAIFKEADSTSAEILISTLFLLAFSNVKDVVDNVNIK